MGYNATTLQQVAVWNATPNGAQGAFGKAGVPGPRQPGNLWLMIANGTFDVNTGGSDYGDSIVKLPFTNPGLKAINYFTLFNQLQLSNSDQDLGSGGIMLLPPQNAPVPPLATGAGKGGTTYLVNRNHPGHFHPGNDKHCSIHSSRRRHRLAQQQLLHARVLARNVYFIGNLDVVRQCPISGGHL